DADKILRRLARNGHTAYLVGGCVRDLLLGRTPKDFDIATSATPPEIKDLFRNSRIIGRRFRLAHIFFGQKIIDTSTFRSTPPRAGGSPQRKVRSGPSGATTSSAPPRRTRAAATSPSTASSMTSRPGR